MYLKEQSCYLSGVTNMASSASNNMTFSYIEAKCFSKDNDPIEELSKYYEIPKEEINFQVLKEDPQEFLINILGNNINIIDGIMHWFRLETGGIEEVYEEITPLITNRISTSEGGYGPFYTLEEIYLLNCKNMYVYLLIGNDE